MATNYEVKEKSVGKGARYLYWNRECSQCGKKPWRPKNQYICDTCKTNRGNDDYDIDDVSITQGRVVKGKPS